MKAVEMEMGLELSNICGVSMLTAAMETRRVWR